MKSAQVVSVFPGCGQEEFAAKNLAVNFHNLMTKREPGEIPWDILRHIYAGVIRRQSAVVTMRPDIHSRLANMGIGAFLVYPGPDARIKSEDDRLLTNNSLMRYEGTHIVLQPGQKLKDVLIYDHDQSEFRPTETAWLHTP